MVKVATLLMIALLLCSTLTYAARPNPAETQHGDGVGADAGDEELKYESCGGIGEEECLKRRTMAAHLDYIYTQKHKP